MCVVILYYAIIYIITYYSMLLYIIFVTDTFSLLYKSSYTQLFLFNSRTFIYVMQ